MRKFAGNTSKNMGTIHEGHHVYASFKSSEKSDHWLIGQK